MKSEPLKGKLCMVELRGGIESLCRAGEIIEQAMDFEKDEEQDLIVFRKEDVAGALQFVLNEMHKDSWFSTGDSNKIASLLGQAFPDLMKKVKTEYNTEEWVVDCQQDNIKENL